MAWGRHIDGRGREIGYEIEATCDQDRCEARIDRGLAYVCGGDHGGAEHGCGGYFCAEHLYMVAGREQRHGVEWPYVVAPQLCDPCARATLHDNEGFQLVV